MQNLKNIFKKFIIVTGVLCAGLIPFSSPVSAKEVYVSSRSQWQIAALDADGQKLVDNINKIINTLSALTGVAIAGSVIYAGILYSTSGGNPNAAKEAKKRISNAVIALLAFVFIYGFLQWIVPGGIF